MTGFARQAGSASDLRWLWELRSVNGKGLDVRFRLAAGHEGLEPELRRMIAQRLARGNVHAMLSVTAHAETLPLVVNTAMLERVFDLFEVYRGRIDPSPPRLEHLLAIRGMVEPATDVIEEHDREELDHALLDGFKHALTALIKMREIEGSALSTTLHAQLDEIGKLVDAVDRDPSRRPEAIRERLGEQVELLIESAPRLDPDRLHHEAVLLATRADIQEELDRLRAHVTAARALLREGGPVGRKLDFLSQEFNRETNTLCAKSNAIAVTAFGLQLKSHVDQFREQIQNLE